MNLLNQISISKRLDLLDFPVHNCGFSSISDKAAESDRTSLLDQPNDKGTGKRK